MSSIFAYDPPSGSSSPPSTPSGPTSSGPAARRYDFTNPSTTPACPPPSSAKSYTPVGNPSSSFLDSSVMQGMASADARFGSSNLAASTNTGKRGLRTSDSGSIGGPGSSRRLFAPNSSQSMPRSRDPAMMKRLQPSQQLGRSLRGIGKRQPSRLSRQVTMDDEDDDEDNEEEEDAPPRGRTGRFSLPADDDDDDEDEEGQGGESDGEGDVDDGEIWLNMHNYPNQQAPAIGDESDLLMLATPAATERVRQEAEEIFRASVRNPPAWRNKELRFASLAKDLYTQLGTAALAEPPRLILATEIQIAQLYDDGIIVPCEKDAEHGWEGPQDDMLTEEHDVNAKLDMTLATVASECANVWRSRAEVLVAQSDVQEHAAEIGPGPYASDFEKANYVANLALQIHHTRYNAGNQGQLAVTGDGGPATTEPLPETLFHWLANHHNLYPAQVEDVLRHQPSPACHGLFWQTVFVTLVRGRVADTARMLRHAGWGMVRGTGGGGNEYAYQGRALENVTRAVGETCAMLEACPGIEGNWDILGGDWKLFHIRAQGALEHLRRFAEAGDGSADMSPARSGRDSLAGMARKAASQVPWEVYENLNVVFEIALGSRAAVLEAAQDWCEATVGLLGWWDERRDEGRQYDDSSLSMSRFRNLAASQHSMGGGFNEPEGYSDRLARSFRAAVDSEFHLNTLSPVEIGLACVFEDNAAGLIGILRAWSLPIAAAVAEVASLGKWLPPSGASGLMGLGGANALLDDLDMDDMHVLGLDRPAKKSPDEVDGIKDSTLVQYAHALADSEALSEVGSSGDSEARDGWELAVLVLGRMDSPQRSEEMVGELVQHLLQNLNVDAGGRVEKIWTLLNELGMVSFAEEAAETYGDVLAQHSKRYGEAMWHYALAHRPGKVREVMNLIISYSLMQSTAWPPAAELDGRLRALLAERNQTLHQLAVQDLEAAELLGKMLSGYASLRQFYDIRDGTSPAIGTSNSTSTSRGKQQTPSTPGFLHPGGMSQARRKQQRQQAATALVSVIASSDDNIRGGLLDRTRDGIVSEDFLLALLGEALMFVHNGGGGIATDVTVSLEQIDTLLKAVEDLQAVGPGVYGDCDEFLGLVLSSAPGGLLGGTPADLLGGKRGGNQALSGASALASQLHRSIGPKGALPGGGASAALKRGWDWRASVPAGTKGEDILQRLRVGLAHDLAGLWLGETDRGVW